MHEAWPEAIATPQSSRRARWSGWAENTAIVILAIGLAVCAVAVLSGNWQALPVLSGSMRPAFEPGDVIIIQREPISQVRVGDIIVFHQPDAPSIVVAHRLTSAKAVAGGVEVGTKGDANSIADPWSPFLLRGSYAYRVWGTVPWVGFVSVTLRRYAIWLVLAAGVAFVVYLIVRRLRPSVIKA
jgi:signal peptidase I